METESYNLHQELRSICVRQTGHQPDEFPERIRAYSFCATCCVIVLRDEVVSVFDALLRSPPHHLGRGWNNRKTLILARDGSICTTRRSLLRYGNYDRRKAENPRLAHKVGVPVNFDLIFGSYTGLPFPK